MSSCCADETADHSGNNSKHTHTLKTTLLVFVDSILKFRHGFSKGVIYKFVSKVVSKRFILR